MIYTSYYANFRKLPSSLKKVSISRITPSWVEVNSVFSALAPSEDLLLRYKQSPMNEKAQKIFTERYFQETLFQLDPARVYRMLDGSVLLCYEKSEDFCHRHIVAEWLKENGFEAEEYKDEAKEEQKEKRASMGLFDFM